jgi:hypothetical protein
MDRQTAAAAIGVTESMKWNTYILGQFWRFPEKGKNVWRDFTKK